MADLIYTAITSLDGYVNDAEGTFAWAAPDEQVHQFVNDLERPVGTYLYGRRMYDVMSVWDLDSMTDDEPAVIQDFAALWRAADKLVYSAGLDAPGTGRTRVLRSFDPDEVRALKARSARDIGIGGATLAASALRAGLVDRLRLLVNPVAVGGGTPALPIGLRLDLGLTAERRFDNGVVYLEYTVAN